MEEEEAEVVEGTSCFVSSLVEVGVELRKRRVRQLRQRKKAGEDVRARVVVGR